MGSSTTNQTNGNSTNEEKSMAELAEHILLLATLVATVTYAAGFNTPGGVWQDTAGHLPGDPIIRSTQYVRYLVFFYCNATAFASSLMVFVLLLLLLFVRHQKNLRIIVIPLVLVMLLGLVSLVGAYAAGTFWDTFSAVYTSVLVVAVFTYVAIRKVQTRAPESEAAGSNAKMIREMLMQLATFALTVTYTAGLSTPGGFWDSTEDGHRPGDAIIKGARLTAYFVCNTTAFVASLLVVMVLLMRKIGQTVVAICGSVVMLFFLLGSYLAGTAGSTSRNAIFFASLTLAIMAFMFIQALVVNAVRKAIISRYISRWFEAYARLPTQDDREEDSLYVQFLAALAFTITYQAGLDPPGGLWQENGDGHKAGDPILRATNPQRYNAFFYCNTVAFTASGVCIILAQIRHLLRNRALEQAMILVLLSLVGAYAIGSCRDETTTVYAIGVGGAALVYVILHVVLLDQKDIHGRRKHEDDPSLDRMGYGLFLFALLVATITYQAGLTPPGGFLLTDDVSGHHAGDPVLFYNYPRFFYCNTSSFMVSIAIIILLVNPSIYRPALRTHALSVSTAVSFFCLLAAFAAGTSQHLKTSIYILVLLSVVLLFTLVLLLVFFMRSVIFPTPTTVEENNAGQLVNNSGQLRDQEDRVLRRQQATRIYCMTAGILVASVTYQAGLDPPGGSWQRSSDGHNAGDPVMQGNRRQRYRAFFYANSTSFVTSVFIMLLLTLIPKRRILIRIRLSLMYCIIVVDFLGLLVAYAAGSGRDSKTSAHVVAIVFSLLTYFSIHVLVSLFWHKSGGQEDSDMDDAQGRQSQESVTPGASPSSP